MARIKELEEQAEKHREEYDDTMFSLRGYKAVPHMKYVTHRQVFGYPKKPKAPTKSPFAAAEKKSENTQRKLVMAWKDRSQIFSEELAAAEKQRDLAIKEAASKEAAKNNEDALVAKMATGRRGM